jgi:cytochrome c oxidase assembly protein subunit 17
VSTTYAQKFQTVCDGCGWVDSAVALDCGVWTEFRGHDATLLCSLQTMGNSAPSAADATPAPATPAATGASGSCPAPKLGKSGKKICCSCPETKLVRDTCVVTNGQEHCATEIEAHKACLRTEGFRVD